MTEVAISLQIKLFHSFTTLGFPSSKIEAQRFKMAKSCTEDDASEPTPATSPSGRRVMKPDDWLPYKPLIKSLYMDKSLTLMDVKATLERDHSLTATYVGTHCFFQPTFR